MGLSHMKDELNSKLWLAMQRWFDLKAEGWTKHELKMKGLREHGNMFYATRALLFTGTTRYAYERELKRFVEWCYRERGIRENGRIKKREFRAYMEHRFAQGGAASEMNKIRASIVKFGAVYGKYESFHAMSIKMGKKIREMRAAGQLRGPSRPHVSSKAREGIIQRLERLDRHWEAATGWPRAYSLVVRLQKEASLRVIEATERLTKESLLGLKGDQGTIRVIGKGGRVRMATISRDLYQSLKAHFERSKAAQLAPRRAYLSALRRAARSSGGRVGGSHAHRRTSAVEHKNTNYRKHLEMGNAPKQARQRARQDTVEHLGHSRHRKDQAVAYLGK